MELIVILILLLTAGIIIYFLSQKMYLEENMTNSAAQTVGSMTGQQPVQMVAQSQATAVASQSQLYQPTGRTSGQQVGNLIGKYISNYGSNFSAAGKNVADNLGVQLVGLGRNINALGLNAEQPIAQFLDSVYDDRTNTLTIPGGVNVRMRGNLDVGGLSINGVPVKASK
jgi:hypothetical protein